MTTHLRSSVFVAILYITDDIQINYVSSKFGHKTLLLHEKAVPHVINVRALTGEKSCINKAIHALLMHGYPTFNMLVPGPQICCRHEMCTARP